MEWNKLVIFDLFNYGKDLASCRRVAALSFWGGMDSSHWTNWGMFCLKASQDSVANKALFGGFGKLPHFGCSVVRALSHFRQAQNAHRIRLLKIRQWTVNWASIQSFDIYNKKPSPKKQRSLRFRSLSTSKLWLLTSVETYQEAKLMTDRFFLPWTSLKSFHLVVRMIAASRLLPSWPLHRDSSRAAGQRVVIGIQQFEEQLICRKINCHLVKAIKFIYFHQ